MKKKSRDFSFWDVYALFTVTITSFLLSVLNPNYCLWINLSHEKYCKESPHFSRGFPF